MKINSHLAIFLTVIVSFTNAFASNTCKDVFLNNNTKHELEGVALNFMRDKGLDEGEYDLPDLGIKSKWQLDKVLKKGCNEGLTFLVMRRFVYTDIGQANPEESFEVLVYSKGKMFLFQDAIKLPKKAIFKVGRIDGSEINSPSYYIELNDPESIADAFKVLYTKENYYGFSGYIVPGAKASYDPTPKRKWAVVDAKFSLKRGMSAEIGDIRSVHFDENFEAYYNGTVQKMTSVGLLGAWVAPWNESTISALIDQSF